MKTQETCCNTSHKIKAFLSLTALDMYYNKSDDLKSRFKAHTFLNRLHADEYNVSALPLIIGFT